MRRATEWWPIRSRAPRARRDCFRSRAVAMRASPDTPAARPGRERDPGGISTRSSTAEGAAPEAPRTPRGNRDCPGPLARRRCCAGIRRDLERTGRQLARRGHSARGDGSVVLGSAASRRPARRRFRSMGSSGRQRVWTLVGADGKPYDSPTPGTFGGHRRNRIYGRLDCPSARRAIARGGYVADRVFFADERDAVAADYRPCAVCIPGAYARWKSAGR